MIRWFPLMGLTALLAGCPVPQAAPPGDIQKLTELATGADYYLYVPTTYDESREWPLVVTLHGTHGWDGPRKQILEWGSLAERQKFIVVAPQLRSVQGILPVVEDWWLRDLAEDERSILAILDEVCGKYKIGTVDGKKAILLTGFSAGGYPMYYVGLRNPERFHMLISRACNSSMQVFEQLQLTDAARDLPIYIYWGKDDLKPIQDQSWAAFAWLRRHRCFRAKQKEIRGGHLRRPDIAYGFWTAELPPRFRM